jgi:glycerol-3-phosphate cytidylyltransferase
MIKGFIAGAFDVIHPGYIAMFKEAKEHCDYLIIGLNKNPEVGGKLKPILTTEERLEILSSIKYINLVLMYSGEEVLYNLLEDSKIDIRFLGDDYKGKKITGEDLNIPIHYLDRTHKWSATKFKTLIYEQIKNEKNSLVSTGV